MGFQEGGKEVRVGMETKREGKEGGEGHDQGDSKLYGLTLWETARTGTAGQQGSSAFGNPIAEQSRLTLHFVSASAPPEESSSLFKSSRNLWNEEGSAMR